jgi:hypothetical protein
MDQQNEKQEMLIHHHHLFFWPNDIENILTSIYSPHHFIKEVEKHELRISVF